MGQTPAMTSSWQLHCEKYRSFYDLKFIFAHFFWFYVNFGAKGRYLGPGYVITPHSILWDAITYPSPRYPPVNTTSWCPRRLGMDKVLWTSLCRLRINCHGNDFMETCAMRDNNHKPALTTKRRRGNFQPIRSIESKESHQVSMTFCLRFEIVWTLRFLKIVCSNVILTLPKLH